MRVVGGLTDPLLFAMIIGMLGFTFLSVWDILLHNPLKNFMTPEMQTVAGRSISTDFGSPLGALAMPFLLVFWMFIVSGMLHLFLLMVRAARAGFEATFRVVSYSQTPFLVMIVPFCGMPIALLWALPLIVIGLRARRSACRRKARSSREKGSGCS